VGVAFWLAAPKSGGVGYQIIFCILLAAYLTKGADLHRN